MFGIKCKPFWKTRRIALTGLAGAGKTVFLTSLLDHLEHPTDKLGLGFKTTLIQTLPTLYKDAQKKDVQKFLKDAHKARLAHRQWPANTLELFQYRGRYVRSDHKHTRYDISFLDVPGERFADLLMAVHPKFDDWSDAILNSYEEEFAHLSREYLAWANSPSSSDEKTCLSRYRGHLAELFANYVPFLTPSSILLSPQGETIYQRVAVDPDAWRKELQENGLLGVDSDRQFAPLPKAIRDAQPALRERFQTHYAAYRDQVVLPLWSHLRGCTDLFVLMDIASMLAGGVARMNSDRLFLKQLFKTLQPGSIFPFFRGLHRLSFIASQADRVHFDDHNVLKELLEKIVDPDVAPLKATKHLKAAYHVCAAVSSTGLPPDDRGQERFLEFDDWEQNGDGEYHWVKKRKAVSALPLDWPAAFDVGEYTFPYPLPRMPQALHVPPQQIGLKTVIQDLFS